MLCTFSLRRPANRPTPDGVEVDGASGIYVFGDAHCLIGLWWQLDAGSPGSGYRGGSLAVGTLPADRVQII